MQGSNTNNRFAGILNNGKEPDEQTEPDIDVGKCAAVARGRWVTALTIRHANKPWESFQYSYLGVRSEYEPTRFMVEFVTHDERYRVVVTGRNLLNIYNVCIQGRLEWIRAADRDFGGDGEQIITKIDVVKLGENEGAAS